MLKSVIMNTLHGGIYMIELFSKAANTSIHVILVQILDVLWWPLGTLSTNGENVNIVWHQYSKQIKYEYFLY